MARKIILFPIIITKNIVEKSLALQNSTYTKIITTMSYDHQLIITVYVTF